MRQRNSYPRAEAARAQAQAEQARNAAERAIAETIATVASAQAKIGFIYGLMELGDGARAVEYGAAHGALAMTTPGDTTMASLAEVEKVVRGGGARVER